MGQPTKYSRLMRISRRQDQPAVHSLQVFIFVAALVLLVAWGSWHGYWRGRSVVPNWESLSILNARANSPSLNHADRARAIFTLFAYHVRSGFSAADMRAVLTNTSWLKAADVSSIGDLAGWIPIDLKSDRTVFGLNLFSTEHYTNEGVWSICFSLSGPSRSSSDGLSFLRGKTTVSDNPTILEFALISPPNQLRGFPGRRIEAYPEYYDIHVYP